MPFAAPLLSGKWVTLVPLAEAHREGLRDAADDERIWRHTLTVARGTEFDAWFDDALSQCNAGMRFPYAVYRLADKKFLGSTSYLDPSEKNRRIEIGSTWYHPDAWGTAVNPECKLLL
ncbi:MAG: GNAT family N-acetyltransferase, partial [Gemmataceae bacterium]|nr:GNAT family N-acetyltransferase [Gemmataceae bacterium]